MTEATVGPADVRQVFDRLSNVDRQPDAAEIDRVSDGVNEVFVVDPADGERLVVKFGTFSTAAHLRAGVAAYRLLGAYTELPVPTVHAFESSPADDPPVVVMDHVPGGSLTDGFHGVDPAAARALGAAVDEFAAVPPAAVDGYGPIRELGGEDGAPRASAEHDDATAWLLDYAEQLYADPPDHDALAAQAPAATEYLRSNRDRLPSAPDPAVVVTDLSPENLRAPEGKPPETDGVSGLTGVLDLERAKLGPQAFTAVNAEYLATRSVSDPARTRAAIYQPLPFGPDVPARELYRLVSMGRSVGALEFWYDPDGKEFQQRAETIAERIGRIVD